MQAKRALIVLGLILLFVGLIWWGVFYGGAANKMGMPVMDFLQETLPCTVYTTDVCALFRSIGGFAGYSPYQPVMLWVALAILVVGIVLPRGRAGSA